MYTNSLSILCYTWCFPQQIVFCSCVKTLIWTCSLKAQVMRWTWISWRLWEVVELQPATHSHLLTTSSRWLHRACHTSLKVCCKVTWHLHGVTHPHPKATRVTSVERRVNFGCHKGIRNGTKPLLAQLIVAELKCLFDPHNQLIVAELKCFFHPHNQLIVAELKCLANLTPHHWTRASQSYYHESCCLPTFLYVTISSFLHVPGCWCCLNLITHALQCPITRKLGTPIWSVMSSNQLECAGCYPHIETKLV